MNYIWSAVHVNQDLPGFTLFGWMKDDEKYEPFMTDKLRARQCCSCKKSVIQYVACNSICCNDSKKGLVCLGVCYQLNCSNAENEKQNLTEE